ncbi:MAG: TetR/AcrR family transcriptional regulator [Sporichthyaceae bacterium]
MINPAPRERLLIAAGELFGRDGVASVGVSRLIERADVGQMSLWRAFGSKRGLIEAWLRQVDAVNLAELRDAAAGDAPPRERLAALIDAYARRAGNPAFGGCPLVRAASEPAATGPVAGDLAREHKEAMLRLFAGLAEQAGAADARGLAAQLLFVIEGAGVAAGLGVDAPLDAAKTAALTLFDVATGETPVATATAPRPGWNPLPTAR